MIICPVKSFRERLVFKFLGPELAFGLSLFRREVGVKNLKILKVHLLPIQKNWIIDSAV